MYKITTNKTGKLVLKTYKSKYTKKLMSNVMNNKSLNFNSLNIAMLQYCTKQTLKRLLKQGVIFACLHKLIVYKKLNCTQKFEHMLNTIVDKKYVILNKMYLNEDCWE